MFLIDFNSKIKTLTLSSDSKFKIKPNEYFFNFLSMKINIFTLDEINLCALYIKKKLNFKIL